MNLDQNIELTNNYQQQKTKNKRKQFNLNFKENFDILYNITTYISHKYI